MSSKSKELEPKIIKVEELLKINNINIPYYQRPYKWTVNNVSQLLNDILFHKDKSAYRLGTIVFHFDCKKNNLEIVDGQQRTVTLILIHLALQEQENKELSKELKDNKYKLPESKLFQTLDFNSEVSRKNIKDNYNEIKRRLVDFDQDIVSFFYEKCELVSIKLNDISEAFQFFDSQNSRGKDLAPHDLLKAFHLREMAHVTTETERIKKVENWEKMESNELRVLFANYLSRIKNWSNSKPSREFTKNDTHLFKGISPYVKERYPFAAIYRISNVYVDAYNDHHDRKIDMQEMNYPFQLDHPLINGKRFFEFVDHYFSVRKNMEAALEKDEKSRKIFEIINTYPGSERTGDRYIRNLFDCCLIYYWDKFENVHFGKIVEKVFVWAYSLRIRHHSVQLATADNYALEYPRFFQNIKAALHPNEILNMRINSLHSNEVVRHIDELIVKFKELNYYE